MRAENTRRWLTVRCEHVSLIDGDAQDVLIHVSDVKLTVKVPLGVHGVVERPGSEDLISHRHFTVGVTFTCTRQADRGANRWVQDRPGDLRPDQETLWLMQEEETSMRWGDETKKWANTWLLSDSVKCDQTGCAGNIQFMHSGDNIRLSN